MIVYNRLPKCGSTLMLHLLHGLLVENKRFDYMSSTHYTHNRFSSAEQIELSKSIIAYSQTLGGRSVVYNQHFHFFNMPSTSTTVFKYINVIRDPLHQALSAFDYVRYMYLTYPNNPLTETLLPSVRNMTMDECVLEGDPARCLTKSYGGMSMISYFCGQSSVCDDTKTRPVSRAALSIAKANINRFYIWVGVLEYLESSLELLGFVLPSIFEGVVNTYRKIIKHSRVNVTPAHYRNVISNKTRTILFELLEPEYELYEFVRMRFINHYRHVFKRSPVIPSTT